MFVHCIDPYSCCGQSDEVDVRIIDFGLAVKCGDNSVRELRGTLEYMGGEDHTSRKTVRAAPRYPRPRMLHAVFTTVTLLFGCIQDVYGVGRIVLDMVFGIRRATEIHSSLHSLELVATPELRFVATVFAMTRG